MPLRSVRSDAGSGEWIPAVLRQYPAQQFHGLHDDAIEDNAFGQR